MDFILFIWPLMAYILKWAVALVALYFLASWWAGAEIKTPILRTALRYIMFVLLFPLMLIIGFFARLLTHSSDRP